MVSPLPRTVILDYYDSCELRFPSDKLIVTDTNNLLTLFTQLYSDEEVLKKVVVIKADRYSWDEFRSTVLPSIDCVILSPGPGRPDKPSDIGFGLELLRAHPVPILGVCLGHQAIGVAFGGRIINTPRITHGHVIPITPVQPAKGLFAQPEWKDGQVGAEGQFDVVVYNSLTVDPESLPAELKVTAWSASTTSERTIQGLKHTEYPIWGVQYHPESISSTRGSSLLHAFLSSVHTYHSSPPSYPILPEHIIASCAYRVTASSSSSRRYRLPLVSPYPTPPISPSPSSASLADRASSPVVIGGTAGEGSRLRLIERRFADVGRDAKTADVFQGLRGSRKGKERAIGEVWLDGETPTRPTTTSLSSPSFLLTYTISSRTVTLHRSNHGPRHLCLEEDTFWDWFADGQSALSARLNESGNGMKGGSRGSGWKGGWVGWMGYEMKVESLAGYVRPDRATVGNGHDGVGVGVGGDKVGEVDAAWAWFDSVLERRKDGEWVARGVVRDDQDGPGLNGDRNGNSIQNGDHRANQEIDANGISASGSSNGDGVDSLVDWLENLGITFGISSSDFDSWVNEDLTPLLTSTPTGLVQSVSTFPSFKPSIAGEEYQRRVELCREAIRQGESYELTLTTRFTASLLPRTTSSSRSAFNQNDTHTNTDMDTEAETRTDPLGLYLRLRSSNPAYYSTYLSFPSLLAPRGKGLTVISSSPERFLKVERGVVEMMPIKGTRARVKPGVCCCGEGGCSGEEKCREIARLEDVRIGEELRNDPKERAENLMIVDLIRSDLLSSCPPSSVIVPKLIALESYGVHNLVTTVRGELAPNVGVVEAVRRCFPPGSMTGAPKLRSVGLLEGFEEGERRGVYSGCLGYFSLDGSTDLSVVIRTMVLEGKELYLGAGGAITWLSNAKKEWDEVLTKVKSVVGNLEGIV